MKKLMITLAAAMLSGPALSAAHTAAPAAATDAPHETSRQCNQQVTDRKLKGEERKAFLKECMKGVSNSTSAPQTLEDKSKPALQSPKP